MSQRSDTVEWSHATRLCLNKKTTFPTQYFWARGKWQRNVDYVEIVWVLGWAGLKYEVWLDRLELYLNFSCTHFSRSLLIWKLSVSGPQLPTSELECHRTARTSAPACVAEKPERVSPSLSILLLLLVSVISGGKSASCLGLQWSGCVLLSSVCFTLQFYQGSGDLYSVIFITRPRVRACK